MLSTPYFLVCINDEDYDMNEYLLRFLRKHEDDLRNNNFYDLYKDRTFPNRLTDDLIEMGINPINYFTIKVPDYYAQDCNIDNINIPSTVTDIGMYAFNECSHLTSVVIPEGVINIGKCAFTNCNRLKYISLPSTIEFLGENCFGGCHKELVIVYGGTTEQLMNIIGVTDITLHIPLIFKDNN